MMRERKKNNFMQSEDKEKERKIIAHKK